jgi:hypothetical protein
VVAPVVQDVARRGQELYDQRLRSTLEAQHHGFFVAIEPDSGDYFIAPKLDEAIQAARAAHPDRLVYAVRIGFGAAVELGSCRA